MEDPNKNIINADIMAKSAETILHDGGIAIHQSKDDLKDVERKNKGEDMEHGKSNNYEVSLDTEDSVNLIEQRTGPPDPKGSSL